MLVMPLIMLDSRKEEKRQTMQQRVVLNERVLALQRTLQEKKEERQRLKQCKSIKNKTSETVSTHNVKSWKAKQVRQQQQPMFLYTVGCRAVVTLFQV